MSMSPGHQAALRKRDAIRILFIIAAAGSFPDASAPQDSVKQLDAELKLQALDFWVRNPDYLAWEMLELHSDPASADAGWALRAAELVKDGEPDVRRNEMLRFLFGAWEALDDSLGTLSAYGLVNRQKVMKGQKGVSTTYYLTSKGQAKVEEWSANDSLSWYWNRAQIVAEVAGARSGSALKQCQHKIASYHDTQYQRHIPPILPDVMSRLASIGGAP